MSNDGDSRTPVCVDGRLRTPAVSVRRRLGAVRALVHGEGVLLDVALAARGARVRPLARVDLLVAPTRRLVEEGAPAHGAQVRLLAAVDALVRLQVAAVPELLAARATRVRPLAAVDALVAQQVLVLAERLAALRAQAQRLRGAAGASSGCARRRKRDARVQALQVFREAQARLEAALARRARERLLARVSAPVHHEVVRVAEPTAALARVRAFVRVCACVAPQTALPVEATAADGAAVRLVCHVVDRCLPASVGTVCVYISVYNSISSKNYVQLCIHIT